MQKQKSKAKIYSLFLRRKICPQRRKRNMLSALTIVIFASSDGLLVAGFFFRGTDRNGAKGQGGHKS